MLWLNEARSSSFEFLRRRDSSTSPVSSPSTVLRRPTNALRALIFSSRRSPCFFSPCFSNIPSTRSSKARPTSRTAPPKSEASFCWSPEKYESAPLRRFLRKCSASYSVIPATSLTCSFALAARNETRRASHSVAMKTKSKTSFRHRDAASIESHKRIDCEPRAWTIPLPMRRGKLSNTVLHRCRDGSLCLRRARSRAELIRFADRKLRQANVD